MQLLDEIYEPAPLVQSGGLFDVPTNTERIDTLEKRVAAVEHPGWTAWIPIGAPIVALLVVGVTLGIHLDNKIGMLQKDIQATTGRLGKVEDAVKVLGNQQPDQTQKIIHDLLVAAKIVGKPEIAARATRVATSLMTVLKEEKRPANPEFFRLTTDNLNALRHQPELKTHAFGTEQQLAEYRSALQPEQTTRGTVFKCAQGPEIAGGFGGDKKVLNKFIESVTIVNCYQDLDGFSWTNVVFVNARIIYSGGPVILNNVIFVNCKFEIKPSDDGFEVLQYAALDQRGLKIRPEEIRMKPSG
jgi:hypothetical protein